MVQPLTAVALQSLGLPADFSAVILRQAEQTVSHWSGGSTRQLAIAPADSELAQRNFRWRFSAASVEQDGAFSAFAGYQRLLMLREGYGLQLTVEQHQLQLNGPTYLARFSGSASTTGRLLAGPVGDLNLIFASDLQGGLSRLIHPQCLDGEQFWQGIEQARLWLILANRPLTLTLPDQQWQLQRGDVAVLHGWFSLTPAAKPATAEPEQIGDDETLGWLGWLCC